MNCVPEEDVGMCLDVAGLAVPLGSHSTQDCDMSDCDWVRVEHAVRRPWFTAVHRVIDFCSWRFAGYRHIEGS